MRLFSGPIGLNDVCRTKKTNSGLGDLRTLSSFICEDFKNQKHQITRSKLKSQDSPRCLRLFLFPDEQMRGNNTFCSLRLVCVVVVVDDRMAVMARASNMVRPELGYQSMSHFIIDTDDLADMLRNIDFCSGTKSKV